MQIYKAEEGFWTRVMSAIAYGLVVAMGAVWLFGALASGPRIEGIEQVWVQAAGSLLFLIPLSLVGARYLAFHQKFVDFLIATEVEMRKVNWSTRREIFGATRVVIGLTLLVAAITFVVDKGFQFLFQQVGVLEKIA